MSSHNSLAIRRDVRALSPPPIPVDEPHLGLELLDQPPIARGPGWPLLRSEPYKSGNEPVKGLEMITQNRQCPRCFEAHNVAVCPSCETARCEGCGQNNTATTKHGNGARLCPACRSRADAGLREQRCSCGGDLPMCRWDQIGARHWGAYCERCEVPVLLLADKGAGENVAGNALDEEVAR